jgi:hypothetical protein
MEDSEKAEESMRRSSEGEAKTTRDNDLHEEKHEDPNNSTVRGI